MMRDLANLLAACAIATLAIGSISVAVHLLPSARAVEYAAPRIFVDRLKDQFQQVNSTKNEEQVNSTKNEEIDDEYVEVRIATHACTKKGTTNIEKLIENSDDFCANKSILARATIQLLAQGHCTETDLAMNRGWIRASERGMFYFSIFCDDFSRKVYLDATSGIIYSVEMEGGAALRRSA